MILFLLTISLIAQFLNDFVIEPHAVEIHPDSFALRYLWRRRKYSFADVNCITRDQVPAPGRRTLPIVRIGFRSGQPLQLEFPGTREKLYHALITAWHAATDESSGAPAPVSNVA